MKTLVFYLVLLVIGTSQAQEVTELKEAKVGFAPSNLERSGDSYSFSVSEAHAGEFEKDPLGFMEANFNIDEFIAQVEDEKYDSYEVNFISKRGYLRADFNKEGDLVRSNSRFKNIILPEKLRSQLYRDHQGWEMTKNIRITTGKNGLVNRDYYKIKLENGKDRKKIILEAPFEGSEIAGN